MKKLKYYVVEKKLLDLGLDVFGALDLIQLFGASRRSAEAFLSYNTRRGLLTRLRKGLYVFSRSLPHDFFLANKIYSPSYISLETALSFYGLIPETIYPILSVTTRKTNVFLVNGKEFVYHKIKKEAFTGYKTHLIDNKMVYLAVKEKAVADLVYLVFLKRKFWYERLDLENVDRRKVEKYLSLFGKKTLIRFWRKLKVK